MSCCTEMENLSEIQNVCLLVCRYFGDGTEKCYLKNPGFVWSPLVQPVRWKNPNCNIITKNKGFRLISGAFFVCNSPYYN